jgi:hypothetical protein
MGRPILRLRLSSGFSFQAFKGLFRNTKAYIIPESGPCNVPEIWKKYYIYKYWYVIGVYLQIHASLLSTMSGKLLPDNRTKKRKNIHRMPERCRIHVPVLCCCVRAPGETKKNNVKIVRLKFWVLQASKTKFLGLCRSSSARSFSNKTKNPSILFPMKGVLDWIRAWL